MRIFLIRHGETVDNVAGLYAGVRDSSLTNHGVDQAQRLGRFLADTQVKLSHIFSSPLSRAFKTAQALQKLQPSSIDSKAGGKELEIVQVPDLIEQDFGFYEGKPFFARSGLKKTGKEAYHDKHKDEPGFVDVERRESMVKRADAFLDEHLIPLIRDEGEGELIIAIVSHGILLGNLWRRLLLRLPRKSLSIAPEVTATRDNMVLERLGGWSNTGYLELTLEKPEPAEISEDTAACVPSRGTDATSDTASLTQDIASEPPASEGVTAKQTAEHLQSADKVLYGWSTCILAVDSKSHLTGLKRQRGGIGRSAHDESQKKLDGFFKRQKTN